MLDFENEPSWTKIKIPVANGHLEFYWPAIVVTGYFAILLDSLLYYTFGVVCGIVLKIILSRQDDDE